MLETAVFPAVFAWLDIADLPAVFAALDMLSFLVELDIAGFFAELVMPDFPDVFA
jgi:hypothetical protein